MAGPTTYLYLTLVPVNQVTSTDNGDPSLTSQPIVVSLTLVPDADLAFGFDPLDGYNVSFTETPNIGGFVVTVSARDSVLQVRKCARNGVLLMLNSL